MAVNELETKKRMNTTGANIGMYRSENELSNKMLMKKWSTQ